MARVVVAFHSGFGHTSAIAHSIAVGAREHPSVRDEDAMTVDVTTLDPVDQESKGYGPAWDPLFEADAIVFGTPTYMGSVSAPFKAFMDASSAVWFEQRWKGVVAGGFTCASSYAGDKLNTITSLAVFAAQHSMVWVGTGQMPAGKDESSVNRMGSFLGLMAQADNDKGPDQHPPAGDHASAKLYGARIAAFADALRMMRGM